MIVCGFCKQNTIEESQLRFKLTNLYEKRDDNLGVEEKIRKNATKQKTDFSLGIYFHRNLVTFLFGMYK